MIAVIAANNGLHGALDKDAAARAAAASTSHPDLLTAAGALLAAVIAEAPLPSGNPALAWDAAATFLALNGRPVTGRPDPDAVLALVTDVLANPDTDPAVIGRRIAAL